MRGCACAAAANTNPPANASARTAFAMRMISLNCKTLTKARLPDCRAGVNRIGPDFCPIACNLLDRTDVDLRKSAFAGRDGSDGARRIRPPAEGLSRPLRG